MKCETIKKGTKLYRFINNTPSNVTIGTIRNNNENYGRFDKNQLVYYCSTSLRTMLIELNRYNICGSLIVSEVQEDIHCGFIENTLLLVKTIDDMNYRRTSNVFDYVTKHYPDGLFYPSANCDRLMCENCLIFPFAGNIALTELGFSKIQEKPPIVYWNKGTNRECVKNIFDAVVKPRIKLCLLQNTQDDTQDDT